METGAKGDRGKTNVAFSASIENDSLSTIVDNHQSPHPDFQQMKAVTKQSAETQAADNLRAQILSGAFLPNALLREQILSSQLEISRSTVRVALQQMVNERLVTRTPYTGWKVTDFAIADMQELITLRACLESFAARTTLQSGSYRYRKPLQEALKKFEHAAVNGSLSECANADFEFHHLIVSLSNHKRLEEHYVILKQQIKLTIAWCNYLIFDQSTIVSQHEPIVEMMCSNDVDGAAQEISDHVITEGQRLIEYLENSRASQRSG